MTGSSSMDDEYSTIIEIDFDENCVEEVMSYVEYRRTDIVERSVARNAQGSFDHGCDNETIYMFGLSFEETLDLRNA